VLVEETDGARNEEREVRRSLPLDARRMMIVAAERVSRTELPPYARPGLCRDNFSSCDWTNDSMKVAMRAGYL
jgi:hypothetical protein